VVGRAELATAIRVINLAGSDDRRDAFKKLANGTTLDWAFFPACTGLEEPLALRWANCEPAMRPPAVSI